MTNANQTTELKPFELAAIEAINKGGRWNGKFYTYSSVKKGKTVIYVSNVQYQVVNKDAFLAALNDNKETVNGQVNSGAGFMMKDTAANWAKVNRYGFDAIENVD